MQRPSAVHHYSSPLRLLVTEEVAVGTPPAQDTAVTTVSWVLMNVTRALAAGPRITRAGSKPCAGLHDTRYARAPAQVAMTVPPWEVSTVPPVTAGEGDGARWMAGDEARSMDGAEGGADRGGVARCSTPSLASARLTATTLSCWPAAGVMPWPRAFTASRLTPVAAPAPTSQAETPRRIRLRTCPG